jgi:hypothetical protein
MSPTVKFLGLENAKDKLILELGTGIGTDAALTGM